MYLADANIFLEILLSQEKTQQCKEALNKYSDKICISDFSLHSIGVILFRYKKEDIFIAFLEDIVFEIPIVTLSRDLYTVLPYVKEKYNLDFDDAYQFKIAEENDFEIITMDRDFDKVKHIIKVKEQRDRQIEVDIGGERG
jgi:predicted nucleic acid-binding protein